jgi:hypothetical protein
VVTQTQLAEFAASGPVVAVCCVRSLDHVVRADELAALKVLEKLAADFDSAEFTDVEVRVQERVFPVRIPL